MDGSFPASTAPGAGQPSQMLYPPQPTTQGNSNSPWDLISLGLEEPLPSPDLRRGQWKLETSHPCDLQYLLGPRGQANPI
jgi:hypothetical protein